jgi:NAD-dependent SIR2 family protein deacetylase
MTKIENIDAECNECEWEGCFEEMEEPIDSDDVHKCPDCGSENVYYFNER